jgi:prophage tail gpP-like protein
MSKILLEVDGVSYEGFTDVAIKSSMENFCSSFSFSATIKETNQGIQLNLFKLQQEAKIYIDDNLIITGYIEQINKSYSASSHQILISGRDIGGDIIDSSVVQKSYNQKFFDKFVNLVLIDNGFNIKVINQVGILTIDSSIKTEPNESVFSFLDRYAKKVQVLLNIDEKGNLNIIREDDNIVRNMLINNYSSDTNILSANLDLTTQDRFNLIEVYSQGDNKAHTKASISQKGKAFDSAIRKTRRKIISIDETSESKSLTALAEWDVNLRRAKGSRYTCKTLGFYSSNKTLWKPNTLVDIIDLMAEVQGTFLIQGVEFSQSFEEGSFTNLTIVERGAFGSSGIKNFGNNFATSLIV